MRLDNTHPVLLRRAGIIPIRLARVHQSDQVVHAPDVGRVTVGLDPPAQAVHCLLLVANGHLAAEPADVDCLQALVVAAEDLGRFGFVEDGVAGVLFVLFGEQEGVFAVDVEPFFEGDAAVFALDLPGPDYLLVA